MEGRASLHNRALFPMSMEDFSPRYVAHMLFQYVPWVSIVALLVLEAGADRNDRCLLLAERSWPFLLFILRNFVVALKASPHRFHGGFPVFVLQLPPTVVSRR